MENTMTYTDGQEFIYQGFIGWLEVNGPVVEFVTEQGSVCRQFGDVDAVRINITDEVHPLQVVN